MCYGKNSWDYVFFFFFLKFAMEFVFKRSVIVDLHKQLT